MFKSGKTAFLVWAIVAIFYAYQYVLRVMPSSMLEDIIRQFGFDASSYGQFSGIYYLGYSLAHIPIGIMLDRIGPRKVITACILLMVIGLLPILFSTTIAYSIAGRALIGIGSSAAILGAFKVIRLVFSEKRFANMLGWTVTIGLIGAIYGGGPVSYMSDQIGYKEVVKVLAASGLILAFITYMLIPNVRAQRDTTIIQDIKEVFSNYRVVFICILGGFMIGPLEGFADVWGMIYLRNVYGIEETIAASLPSLMFVGMSIGAPIITFVAEKTGFYIGTIVASAVVMAAGFILLLSGMLSVNAISIVFILIGICCAYQILVIFKASTYVKEHVVSLTNAAANMIIMAFGYILHSSIGFVIDISGGRNNVQALSLGIATIPTAIGIAILGFGVMTLIDKRRNRQKNVEIIPVGN